MITKNAVRDDGTVCRAIYSDCEQYRYDLVWRWSETDPLLVVWMLNPSTATEIELDNTVKGISSRARAQGYGGFRIINLFAYRDTDPWAMRKVQDPIGPHNDAVIRQVLKEAVAGGDTVVCGWGEHGNHNARASAVADLAAESGVTLHTYGINADKSPRHPLYTAHAKLPIAWVPDVAGA